MRKFFARSPRARGSAVAFILVAAPIFGLAACRPAASSVTGGTPAAGSVTATLAVSATTSLTATAPVTASASMSYTESDLITNARQLVIEGERSGEGYFSRDGSRMIFQSERVPGNPFYQEYLLDMTTGDVQQLSTGIGKTTCGWIDPTANKVLFASTHEDPNAAKAMKDLLDQRAAGKAPRYSFEYDDTYEIYAVVPGSHDYVNLTKSPGYDAEGSWSPDGTQIVFTSNRLAYTEAASMTDEDRKAFKDDPSYMADIYLMNSDGSNVRRLTDHKGYDGGPFFSPDGARILWRSFTPDGAQAEIWTMALDGSDKKQLTHLGVLSWAPFYHPSGQYVIFSTNVLGFANFELYMVDVDGAKEPRRVTFTDGSDVLPVFSPDGSKLSWVNRRSADGKAQIWLADWNDAKAREILALAPKQGEAHYDAGAGEAAAADMAATVPEIRAEDAELHVQHLAAPEMDGRMTGKPGEARATAYVADAFQQLGLTPAGDDGFFQPFKFTAGVSLQGTNVLSIQDGAGGKTEAPIDVDWRPLPFSKPGSVGFADLVFAGYGLEAPADGDQATYDSYGQLDVAGKWVVVLRYLPEDVSPERRQHLSRHSALRFKVMEARDRGAKGVIVVSGPTSQVKEQLVPLTFDGSMAGAAIPALSITDALAETLFKPSGQTLAAAQKALDGGEVVPGFALPGHTIGAHIELAFDESTGRNVVGRLTLGSTPSKQVVVIGAHVDHLGHGEAGGSLATGSEAGQAHPGADDNASGVAGLVEIAQALEAERKAGKLANAKRDILFAAWSGEELGLLGSSHFAKTYRGGATEAPTDTLYPDIAAYLNMDMIGRLRKDLLLQGVGSSPFWKADIEKRNVVIGLPVKLSDDSYLPTDATSFYLKGVPILAAFTGVHSEYHTPRDTADRLDYAALAKVAHLVQLLAVDVSAAAEPPAYVKLAPTGAEGNRRVGHVFLGTVPDYAAMATGGSGVTLSGVSAESPAQKAGLAAGDVVVEMAGQAIGDIYEYTRVLDALKIGQETTIVVMRGGQRLTLKITPASRD